MAGLTVHERNEVNKATAIQDYQKAGRGILREMKTL